MKAIPDALRAALTDLLAHELVELAHLTLPLHFAGSA